MNAPMANTQKTIYATNRGVNLPTNIKKLLVGAVIMWQDTNPMSENMDDALHFFFDSKTTKITDMLLKKHGLYDVGQFVNISFDWLVEMENKYLMPNHSSKAAFIEPFSFRFRGTVFPMTETFRKKRDAFYMSKNLEVAMTPDDHKNKGIYDTSYFKLTVLGV